MLQDLAGTNPERDMTGGALGWAGGDIPLSGSFFAVGSQLWLDRSHMDAGPV